jgi:hypothetical protein
MTKTINSYVSDGGEVVVTLSAGNVTAVSGFTTAESITIDGAVRKFSRTNTPQRTVAETKVTGSDTPIVTRSQNKAEGERWELTLVDDYYSGAAGEWGTDDLAAVEIFKLLDENNEDPGGLKCTPAGGATGDIEITLTLPKLLGVKVPDIDADATTPNEIIVYLAADGHTTAAHA